VTLVVQPYTLPAVVPLAGAPAVITGPVLVGNLPLAVNLSLYQGDDFWLDLTVTDTGGNPVNLSAYTPTAVIRGAPGSPTVAAFTCTVDTTNTNVVHLWLPHLQSMLLNRRGVWDCQVEQSGAVTTLVAGTVTTSLEVTVG
jgi:hypothetical protein